MASRAAFHPLPTLNHEFISACENFILLESNRADEDCLHSYLFWNPRDLLTVTEAVEVDGAFKMIDELSRRFYLAGYFAYELGHHWHPTLSDRGASVSPLLQLGVFETALVFDHRKNKFLSEPPGGLLDPNQLECAYAISDMELAISEAAYRERIARIKRYIEAGDTYQVNFTTRYRFKFDGQPWALYQDLKRKQAVAFNAFMKFGDRQIISLSPELYFNKSGRSITTRPMKGTTARGRTTTEDEAAAAFLHSDEKNRSENVMIADLMRNDLGRISETGSVQVSNLFRVEKYDTLLQMTSTVASTLRPDVNYSDIFSALFPSGSITGAPKLRTMEIIQELENAERGVYTGAIGFTAPDGNAQFNVPIRTLTVCDGRGEMGVGSGIVYDSDAGLEFDECKLKAHFLLEDFHEFCLLESLRWQNGFQRLERHLARLADSAAYFDFVYVREEVEAQLRDLEREFEPLVAYKVRLSLRRNGQLTGTAELVQDRPAVRGRVTFSAYTTRSDDRFLFHKTSLRALYQAEHEKYTKMDFVDVLFFNERGQVTEGAISNVFVKYGNEYVTPPAECGLLNGVFRQGFLSQNANAVERVLSKQDVLDAEAVYLTNSVRGMVRVDVS